MNSGRTDKETEVMASGESQFDRPNSPAMENLEALIRRIHETEDALRTLSEQRDEMVKELASQIKDRDERLRAINYLYWIVPEISVGSIGKAFLEGEKKDENLKSLIQPLRLNLFCERCGKQFRFLSRTEKERVLTKDYGLKEHPPAPESRCSQPRIPSHHKKRRYWEDLITVAELVCDQCHHNIIGDRMDQHFERQAMWEAKRKERLKELRTMPYQEYLQTPEWHRRRWYHLKTTGGRCQVCNVSAKEKRLNVHHRKYTTIGNEGFTDLIVLCEDCHQLFHREGKLVKEKR